MCNNDSLNTTVMEDILIMADLTLLITEEAGL
jgi:hypothetical protein